MEHLRVVGAAMELRRSIVGLPVLCWSIETGCGMLLRPNVTPANDGTALPAGEELLLERLGTAIQVREGASLHRACWLRCDARGGCEERRGRRAGASLRSNGHTRLYVTAVRAADLPKNQPAYA